MVNQPGGENKCLLSFPIPSLGRCELYGDPHYISFEGVTFDFLEDCTYILVEEPSPRHHLTIVVDNFYCVPGIPGSCVKGIMLKYQNSTARLSIMPHLFAVQVGCNSALCLFKCVIFLLIYWLLYFSVECY